MPPSERSTTLGTSSLATNRDASKYPGLPGWILPFPDCVSNSGSQPISICEPVQINRPADRPRAIRLGRASIRSASCIAVVAEYTDTRAPASSCASAAHSGSQANTLSAADTGHESIENARTRRSLMIVFIVGTSEFVGAVRAQAHDVLEQHLIVGGTQPRFVARELQPDAAELARAPVGHHGVAGRVVRAQNREVRGGERARGDQAEFGRAGVQPVVAVAGAPPADKLVHALQVPPRLPRGERAGLGPERLREGVVGQIAVLPAPEVLALQLEIGGGRVPVRRPFQDPVERPEPAPAVIAVGHIRAGGVKIVEAAVPGRGAEIRNSG